MRDRHYERRLDELGIGYEYATTVDLSDIKETVQSRVITVGEIPEEVRRHEVNARTSGTTHYPPFVLGKRSDGSYVLLDGHQRRAGFRRAGVGSHDAYVIRDSDKWTIAAQGINTEHGLPPTEEERMVRAKESVRGGMTQQDAARLWRLSPDMLGNSIRADRVEAMAISEGASARMLERLPLTTKVYAHKIRRAPVLKATLEAISRSGSKGGDAMAIVDRAVSARSDEEAMAFLARIAGSGVSDNGKKPRAAGAITASCSRVLTSIRKYPPSECRTEEDRQRVSAAVEEAADALLSYLEALR